MRRLRELDSLRGIAALTVVFHHFMSILPSIYSAPAGQSLKIDLIKYSPFHLVWAGHEAVILFFVLSGFVLSLPFLDGKDVKYTHFLIKRVCRIYIPYFFAITIAIMLDFLLSRHGISQLSGWFQAVWTANISEPLVLSHYLLVGSFDNTQFDPVIWSLVQEMRISLIFPILVYVAKRFDWKIILGISLIIYVYVGFDVASIFTKYYPDSDLSSTARYLLIFVIGILLAKHRIDLINSFKKIPTFFKYVLLLIALLLYVNVWITFGLGVQVPYPALIGDLITSVGVCLIVIGTLAFARLSNILLCQPLVYLGKISYSLYLFHAIVLFAFLNVLFGKLPLAVILSMVLVTALVISVLSYRFIEEPSISLGKYLTRSRKSVSIQRAVPVIVEEKLVAPQREFREI